MVDPPGLRCLSGCRDAGPCGTLSRGGMVGWGSEWILRGLAFLLMFRDASPCGTLSRGGMLG